MSAYLWKVTTKKQVGKLPAGASVEIVKNNTNAKPTQKEINEAYNEKYGVDEVLYLQVTMTYSCASN